MMSDKQPNGGPPIGLDPIPISASNRLIVFVGPSFPSSRVHEFVPDAELRPPIKRGDLDDIHPPSFVAIIDGIFDEQLAISTREIRLAIGRGVRIAGSSSMGAMRAAEVSEMIGVGRVYEMFRDGVLERDDEVALLLDSDTGRALTEPLANIRYAVQSLVDAGSVDERLAARIVESSAALHFHDRTYRNILRIVGVPPGPETEILRGALRSFDLKRDDAQSLLESVHLLSLKSAATPTAVVDVVVGYHDHFDLVDVAATAPPNAKIRVWECGEEIDIAQLADFITASGRIEKYASAMPRDDSGSALLASLEQTADSVQDMFYATMAAWGWRAPEEVHVTLNDLGIGSDELQDALRLERERQIHVRASVGARSDRWLRALRLSLFLDDLGLKREAMRLGALHRLAATTVEREPSDVEMDGARRALLSDTPELSWNGLLDKAGVTEQRVSHIVQLVARARRVGVPLTDQMSGGPLEAEAPRRGLDPVGLVDLPESPFASMSDARSTSNIDSERVARRLADVIGVTRIAHIGELERFHLFVASAYRPSDWSSTIGSGKSESSAGAVIGAIVEEVEKYCQDKFCAQTSLVASYRDAKCDDLLCPVDPCELALPYDSPYAENVELTWTWMEDVVSGHRNLVPAALLTSQRLRNDVLFSPRRGRKVFTTNGLAGSFTLTEALAHALCEKIERHALKLAEQDISNPGGLPGARWPDYSFVNLESTPIGTQRLVRRIRDAGFELRALDITSEVAVPTFAVRIMRPDALHGLTERYAGGSCAHPNPELALNRAILEAVQTRVASISGAREDLGMNARSLGRHERPRPLSKGDAYWIRPHVPKKPFASVAGHVASSAREALDFVVRRVVDAGFDQVLYRDLSRHEVAPAKVVRVLVPGMEDTNPFHTGLRARARIVRDLMHRHEW